MLVLALLGASACVRTDVPGRVRLISPAEQQAAAEKIARAFVEVCLTEPDPAAARRMLRSRGWPHWGQVWDDADGVFLAARPFPGSPAGLFVLVDRGRPGLTCVGHYPAGVADGDAPMVGAIERRWGPSRAGPARSPGSRAWAFRIRNGAVAPADVSEGAGGPATAAALAALRPGEALVYAEVSYNAYIHDVASVVSVRRAGG